MKLNAPDVCVCVGLPDAQGLEFDENSRTLDF